MGGMDTAAVSAGAARATMKLRGRSQMAWAGWALSASMGLAAVGLSASGPSMWQAFLLGGHPDSVVIAVAGGFFAALIVSYRPANPVGWLLLANAAAHGAHALASQYGAFALRSGTAAGGVAAWVGLIPLVASGPLLALALLRFPDGRPLSRRWRPVEWALIGLGAVAVVSAAAAGWPLRGTALLDGASIPKTHAARLYRAVTHLGQPIIAVGLVAAAVALFLRYRTSTGVVRHQVKWVAFGAVPLIGLLVAAHVVHGTAAGFLAMASPVVELVALTVAIRRYHLYDIDSIISRSVAWLALTGALTFAYLFASTAVGSLFSSPRSSRIAPAAGAALAAVLFQPLRRFLQEQSDRRFRRRAFEARRIVDDYLASLAKMAPAAGELEARLATALGDPSVTFIFWAPDRQGYIDPDGAPTDSPEPGPRRELLRVDRGGEHLGVVVHDPVRPPDDPTVLASILPTLAPAFDHARLRAQTALRLAEVRASRARLVVAADEARRRVERDLHDGAQQLLVALGLKLGGIRSRLSRQGDTDLAASLASSQAELDRALNELRELARGIHPAVLTEGGLEPALESLVERCPMRVVTRLEGGRRFDPAVEVTAYYVVAEALTNASKHAEGSTVSLRVEVAGSALMIEVADDGPGGARFGAGSGLAGLADRVEAVGGQLRVDSPVGAGTKITAELPA